MPGGPASDLADFVKGLGKRKLRSYKTQKDLREVLCKCGIDSNDIKKIPPFVPEPVKINNEHFQYCLKMGIISPAKSSNDIYIVKNKIR